MVKSSWFEQVFIKLYVTLRWCNDGLDIVLGVLPLCLLLLICGCSTVTLQGTFIFLAGVKGLLKGKKNHLAVFAPLVAFQSSVLPWEKKFILKSLQLPARLSELCKVLAGVWIRLFGNSAGLVPGLEGGTRQLRHSEGAASCSVCLVCCLFCFSYSLGWGGQIHSGVLSVWGR